MAGTSNEVSALIRELRREHKLTQVQFANELGLSPATIHRYEAGARPNASALLALLGFAEKRGHTAITNALRGVLSERVILPGDPKIFISHEFGDASSASILAQMLSGLANQLSEPQQVRLLAFGTLLRENTDSTVEKMLDFLMKPWIHRAKEMSQSQSAHGLPPEED